ncbi:MAG: hypothetical protein CVU97_07550, partial [Firmicutes bacterium HGW-Firmicutes-21]
MNGIDVSKWQGKIDWKRVKNSGIDFAFIKASQGGSIAASAISPFTDSCFKSNITEAAAAGISCGVYHYLTGTTNEDVIAEAEYLISILEQYKDLVVFPVALDFEDSRYTAYHKTFNSALIRIFTDIVKNAGYTPLLYANRSFLRTHIDMSSLSDLDIWYARYYTPRSKEKTPDDLPEALMKKVTVWQWSDSGTVDGIIGKVDMNVSFFDYAKVNVIVEEQEKAPPFAVGDTVEIKQASVHYFEGGAVIPRWVKDDYDHIITSDTYYKKQVIKSGSR